MHLKINRSVKSPWNKPSTGEARFTLWAPEVNVLKYTWNSVTKGRQLIINWIKKINYSSSCKILLGKSSYMQIWESLLERRVQLALLTAKQCRRLDCKTKLPFPHCSSLLSWIPATENIDTTKNKKVALVSISYYCCEPLIFESPVVPWVSCHCYGFMFAGFKLFTGQ